MNTINDFQPRKKNKTNKEKAMNERLSEEITYSFVFFFLEFFEFNSKVQTSSTDHEMTMNSIAHVICAIKKN